VVLVLKHEVWVAKVIPALIFFSLWLDGWFFPLILLPIIYVLFIEKKNLGWLGFSRHGLYFSLNIGVIIAFVLSVMYYPIFLYYLPMMKMEIITLYSIFLDVVWYPIYEEVTYRSFLLSHFAKLDRSYLSSRNLIVNVFQTFLFLSIHKHHSSTPLVLLHVFFLGLVNGFLFLKTRNIYGCIVLLLKISVSSCAITEQRSKLL
jgi:membrane protease YdiL (CAAX protease family)